MSSSVVEVEPVQAPPRDSKPAAISMTVPVLHENKAQVLFGPKQLSLVLFSGCTPSFWLPEFDLHHNLAY